MKNTPSNDDLYFFMKNAKKELSEKCNQKDDVSDIVYHEDLDE